MDLLENLSEVQMEAVETIDENLEIIACAGAGKTGVVTRRIDNILASKPEILPENIVALTFTKRAAEELKSRIYDYGKAVLGHNMGFAHMYVGTIHGFCIKIQENIPEFQKFSVMDEIHTKLFVERFYEECGMQDLDMRKYIETSLFVSVMSILNENWFEKDRWDAKTMKSSSLVQYDISDIAYAEYKNAEEEFGFIVNRIVKLHSIGVPYSEMAVLLRKCDKENCSKCHFNYLCLSKAEKKVFEIG